MKLILAVLFASLGASVVTVVGAPQGHLELNDNVAKIVLEHFPKAEIAVDNGKLVAKHGTMVFTVHRRSKTGVVGRKTDQVEGPNHRGFILSISVQDGEYHGAAEVPQTLSRPYWKTYIDRPTGRDGKSHYVINFSYGSGLNREFTKAVFKALTSAKSEDGVGQPATDPESKGDGTKRPKLESERCSR